MKARGFLLIALCACSAFMFGAQDAAPAPQTPRQALVEMFFSKTPGTFIKHVPDATIAAFAKAGATTSIAPYLAISSQVSSQQKNLQTFETGPILLSFDDPKTGNKIEVMVESDTMHNDQDEIELSFRTYKNGKVQRTPFMSRLTCAMKMESGVWKLNEIGFALRVPLADPDLLKTITDNMKTKSTFTPVAPTLEAGSPLATTAFHGTGSNDAVVSAMRTILSAETTYASTYPTVGYTCTLSDLDGFGSGERNEHQAMLINSGLASGRHFGYVFALSQCAGVPAKTFSLTASPATSFNGGFTRRAYCADQSGMVRYSEDGNPATCMASGTPMPN